MPDLDPAHDGLRIAQLSDLHVGAMTPVERIRAAIAEANRFRPDLVVLTGDYLSHDQAGVALMREQLGGLEAPTLATLGNHDRWVDPRGAGAALEDLGYGFLENQNTTLTLRHAPFTVIGIDDLWTYSADTPRAMKGAPAGSRLYLAHVPATADILANWGKPMLVLSGHTHGGQVNVPLLTPAIRWMIRRAVHRRVVPGREGSTLREPRRGQRGAGPAHQRASRGLLAHPSRRSRVTGEGALQGCRRAWRGGR